MMNPREALFGFMGWLTSRDEVVSFGASKNCQPAVDLLVQWADYNNLEEVSENYPDNIKHPIKEKK